MMPYEPAPGEPVDNDYAPYSQQPTDIYSHGEPAYLPDDTEEPVVTAADLLSMVAPDEPIEEEEPVHTETGK